MRSRYFCTYLPSTSASRFTRSPGAAIAERSSPRACAGSARRRSRRPRRRTTRQRDAVDRDRALRRPAAPRTRDRSRRAKRTSSPWRSSARTRPVPSTWPCTMWPSRRRRRASRARGSRAQPAAQVAERACARASRAPPRRRARLGVERRHREAGAVHRDAVAERTPSRDGPAPRSRAASISPVRARSLRRARPSRRSR